ncbi:MULTISPECIES: DUF29 domain-containing protein [Methylomicrobium]|uniref:DUF29 domain-containing protein n=1 Tax=Methylomicrobium album BG8 TaxID=686340 RepID=H8GQK6_METAL|nr:MULTISPECIES: DUF29 domain-containing protein [Methylomicrobium]EIC29833.1 protein of unknown function DUF29 [Methylomicrobium album BG8]
MKASNYETDFYTWTQQQAALLKAGRLSEIDVEHLIEEIETMGRAERREYESRLFVLLLHLLKWQYQPVRRGRSWLLTIKEQRIQFVEVVDENPGLRPQLPMILKSAYRLALVRAARETGLDDSTFPVECPWTMDQITDQTYFPGGDA